MAVWIIEPRDPLIFRGGKPFTAIAGARASSLPFPNPSTTTGAVRSKEGLDDLGIFQIDEIPRIKNIAVRGPLLVILDDCGGIEQWLPPAPGDAVLFNIKDSSEKASLKRLLPIRMLPGAKTNLPEGLSPVSFRRSDQKKPYREAPGYWYWKYFEKWLAKPEEKTVNLNEIGNAGPILEVSRFHVAIDSETGAAKEHALFSTQGLEFTDNKWNRLALAVEAKANDIKADVSPLGGERRLTIWRKSKHDLPLGPEKLFAGIAEDKFCRLILLTPAYFKAGWQPDWLLSAPEDVKVELKAMALQRHRLISGWDMEGVGRNGRRGCPKPTRRLVPAGTVLFLELTGTEGAIERWAQNIWFSNVSDDAQDRLDGFGLAVLGRWDGALQDMEVK